MTLRNLMITMVLGGLWHGANWTFLAWGVFHGMLLCGYRLVSNDNTGQSKSLARNVISAFVMFQLVCFGWLLFRAASISQAANILHHMMSNWSTSATALSGVAMIVVFVWPLLLYEAWVEVQGDLLALLKRHWLLRAVVYSYAAFMMLFFSSAAQHEFIYFQF